MSRELYPLMLDMSGRLAIVVGGGPVAARRARGLLQSGARVRVVAPEVCEDLADDVRSGDVEWIEREAELADLDDPDLWLVHTATGARADALIAQACSARRIWCVRADNASASSAWTPAVVRDAGATIAISGGGDPTRAQRIRRGIENGLALGDIAGVHVRRGRRADGAMGRVALVGGGPGHPDLITVRGRRLLSEADVVVTDRLGPRALLEGLEAEIIDVGKTPGHHPMPQESINRLLVEQAQRGRLVVRLKGGDPFVLGRGGEEALHCLAEGVPVEVVPGVTSAVSVPAAAGIPVTHRGITTSFVVASAHDGPAGILAACRSAAPDATLILLMGVTALEQTAASLMADGRPADTPAAIIENGTLPAQRTTVATLSTLAQKALERGVASPAIIVIGEVVRLHDELGAVGGVAAAISLGAD